MVRVLIQVLAFYALAVAREYDVDVIVVGGGMAGLGAAEQLSKANIHNFLLLEAREYIGGRVHAEPFGNPSVRRGIVETGANWVHGASNRNPVWELAQHSGLATRPVPGSCANVSGYALFGSNGSRAQDASERATRVDRMYDCLNATAQNLTRDESVIAGMSTCGWGTGDKLHEALAWEVSSANDMLPPKKLSLQFMLPDPTYSWLGSDDYFVYDQRPLGYSAIAYEVLANAGLSLNDSRVLLKTIVQRIDSSQCDRVRVHTADGREFRSRYVISTLPLGVMQGDIPIFFPKLPTPQTSALAAFTMGKFTKIFIQFPQPFWSSRGAQWIAGGDHPHDPMEFHDLDNLVPGFSALFTYVTDEASVAWEAMSDVEASAALVERLRRLFPDVQIGQPVAFYMTRHSSDPFMRGAYSAASLGFTDDDFKSMIAPVESCGSLRVAFGGEHTCEAYLGYLHGAYISGLDAASDVLSDMGMSSLVFPPRTTCKDRESGRAWRRLPHGANTAEEVTVLV